MRLSLLVLVAASLASVGACSPPPVDPDTLPHGAGGKDGGPTTHTGDDGGRTPDPGDDADVDEPDLPPGPPPDWGPNVKIFDPSMSRDEIQGQLNDISGKQEGNHFGEERYAYFFKPGNYELDVRIGFFMHVLGLGTSPDDVSIKGAVRSKADWFGGNATQNFWRGAENFSVEPTEDGNRNVWAVSQGTWLRRVHVKGALALSDNGWSSGGFIVDSKVDERIESGSQQQFFTRNTALGDWQGGSWNMVFVGDDQAPQGNWPGPHTVIDTTPAIREKPYLTIDGDGHYWVMVPKLAKGTRGTTWGQGTSTAKKITTDKFFVAHAGDDDASSINAALDAGKHLILTPGVYHLDTPLHVSRAHTVVMALGLATLKPEQGNEALLVDDVDDVSISGILFDAGGKESPTMLRLGPPGSAQAHKEAPTTIHDITCRIGGAGDARTSSCITVNSGDVIGDNLWLWRADHGDGADWDHNPSKNGIIVNGRDVTMYGLFVEHFQEYQTLWNGEGGHVYFYQSELPYDPPSQGQWKHGSVNGWASYKVADGVKSHEAWGLGAYCVFHNGVTEENAFETPTTDGVSMHHMVTEWLGVDGNSRISHIINGTGDEVNSGNRQAKTSF